MNGTTKRLKTLNITRGLKAARDGVKLYQYFADTARNPRSRRDAKHNLEATLRTLAYFQREYRKLTKGKRK